MASESGEVGDGRGDDVEFHLSVEQMEYHLKMAEERRRALEIELELARLPAEATMRGQALGGNDLTSERSSEWRRYSKLLSGAFPKFPSDAEVPMWFESVEGTLEAYDVPRQFWGQVVFPMIAERMEYLSTRLTAAQHRDYESVKEVVLEELKLSPAEYKGRFLGARKRKTETWKSFATRLRSFLNFYVSSRDVQTYEELVELFVVDQLKTGLSGEALKYVTLREGTTWFRSSELARLLQTFDDAAGNMRTPEVQLSGAKPKAPPRPFSGYANRGTELGGNPNTRPKQPHSGGRESKP